ncbi:unnamed protein product [Triticum turgidum subsp. durum]|uniref:Cytochrome P450 n=1 Tax=Triticum turgidum subsp. durum TaxID=4567 RepID=A0A9R0RAG8_TRITD|nr:unnamed protein product [Triticum turgidum subsp. durum]
MDSPLPFLVAMSSLLLILAGLYMTRLGLLGKRRRSYPPVAGTMLHQLLNWGRLPEYMTELSRRYRQNVGGLQEFTACLTEDAISSMHYLHATLTETLRLYPAVPTDVKCCFSDDTLPDGHTVRRGDMVNYLPYAMGRMKFLWGDDAEEFRPERWLDDEGVFVPKSPYKFTAFQAGPRICLGKEFAYRQMKIFAATLLYLFRFEMWERDSTVGYRPMLTLKMDGPLCVRASPRRSTGN